MKQLLRPALMLLCALTLTACSATADERTGSAQGYGGEVKVSITMEGERITGVKVLEHHETEGIGSRAVDMLPGRIAEVGSTQVDIVSGATVTSNAIIAAVNAAAGTAAPSASPEASPSRAPVSDTAYKSGTGMVASGRVGPGKDDAGNPVYSLNVVFAFGMFDDAGRIAHLSVDQLEVATPNYDGATMPHFSGFPGQGGYALWDDAQGKTSGKTEDTEDSFLAEVAAWQTKRDRGEDYRLTSGTWAEQMDAYERLFIGMTVDEVEAWFQQYCSDTNGRPLTAEVTDEAALKKYNALTDADKTALADVTSTATMSLRDAHGDILGAIRKAWENAR